jgi:glyoxylase-like metal-dependent hydrolase (beta-lactamase superfamily II)
MREVRPGLWHWQAPHPDWTPEEQWPQVVSSYALDDGTHLLLFDPLAAPEEILQLAIRREPVVLLTAPWHERDTRSLVERFDARVYAPPPDSADDLVRKFGISPGDAPGGSPDLAWLLSGDGGEAHLYAAGDRLPFGIEAILGREPNDLLLWIEGRRVLVCGDSLVDFGRGFGMNEALRGGVTREEVVDRLRPLLDRPVDVVLPAHGAPTDRSALERALAQP